MSVKRSGWIGLGVALILAAAAAYFLLSRGGSDEVAEGKDNGPAHHQAQAKNQAGQGGGGQRGGPGGGDQAPTPVAVAAVIVGSIANHYSATATLEADKEAVILSRAQGLVMHITAEEGDMVRKGQELLRIEDTEYRLRVDQAQAALANAQSKYERAQKLREQDLLSNDEYDTVANDFKNAEADLGLQALSLSYTSVTAPFSGKIVARAVDLGQTITTGVELFRLADFNPLIAEVHVPAREFKRLAQDQAVDLVLDSNQTQLKGFIKLISPVIDPQSGTIKLTVEISEYPQGTRPGDFVSVHIVTERHDQAILVPKISVVDEKGESVVYVAAADSTADRRMVTVGFQDDRHAEILSGVEEGEPVIVRGQRTLKHGARINVAEDVLPSGTPDQANS